MGSARGFRRRTVGLAVVVLTLLSAGCTGWASNEAVVGYAVRLRDGGSVAVSVRYRLPTGRIRSLEVMTPWAADSLTFQEGSTLLVEAKAKSDNVSSPLVCVLDAGRDGEYASGGVDLPLNACLSRYKLGQWPPDEDDPFGNRLIRVG